MIHRRGLLKTIVGLVLCFLGLRPRRAVSAPIAMAKRATTGELRRLDALGEAFEEVGTIEWDYRLDKGCWVLAFVTHLSPEYGWFSSKTGSTLGEVIDKFVADLERRKSPFADRYHAALRRNS